ncbi:MAG: DNA polymerase III subunit beta [Nitrososphaeria archaeon]
MVFTINTDSIKKLMAGLGNNVSRDKNSILGNYHINISTDSFVITATNETDQVSMSVPIQSDIESSFLVKSDFFDRLKFLSGDVVFSLENNVLKLQNNSFTTTVKTTQDDGYPLETIEDYNILGNFSVKDIVDLSKVYIASSKSESATRELMGVLIDIKNNAINFVATDRTRLFWNRKPIKDNLDFYCIVEKNAIQHLVRHIEESDSLTILYKKDNEGNIVRIAFKFDSTIIISKTIKGKFPAYEKVILDNMENTKHAVVKRSDFKNALIKVLPLANSDLIYTDINFDNENMEIKTANDGEEAIDIVSLQQPITDPFSFTISGKYLMDFLNSSQADILHIYYKEGKPIEIKAENGTGIEYRYVMVVVKK